MLPIKTAEGDIATIRIQQQENGSASSQVSISDDALSAFAFDPQSSKVLRAACQRRDRRTAAQWLAAKPARFV